MLKNLVDFRTNTRVVHIIGLSLKLLNLQRLFQVTNGLFSMGDFASDPRYRLHKNRGNQQVFLQATLNFFNKFFQGKCQSQQQRVG